MSEAAELSRLIKPRLLPNEPVVIEANESERAALTARFDLSDVASLRAEVSLDRRENGLVANGILRASILQSCAVSGEDFPVTIEETLDLLFVPEGSIDAAPSEDDEIDFDLTSEDCDTIEYAGDAFDLGEAVAQTLGLAIDLYAEGPNADAARSAAGLSDEDTPSGPLADALAALKKG
ncbi:MAG: DUF177 domain-containing protein [Erythrobacter sp.]